MATALQKNIDTTFNELVQAISLFTDEQMNIVPFEGSWTAAQAGDHISKSFGRLGWVGSCTTEETKRQPDEKVAAVSAIFLDFSRKMQSPDFILPSSNPPSKAELFSAYEKAKEQMLQIAELPGMELTCIGHELPGMGPFTRLEWLNFYLLHTQRHTQQLKNIAAAIQNH